MVSLRSTRDFFFLLRRIFLFLFPFCKKYFLGFIKEKNNNKKLKKRSVHREEDKPLPSLSPFPLSSSPTSLSAALWLCLSPPLIPSQPPKPHPHSPSSPKSPSLPPWSPSCPLLLSPNHSRLLLPSLLTRLSPPMSTPAWNL